MQNRPQKPDTLLEIRLFGAPVFLQANGESVPLPGRKDRALLAYLATHPDVSLARDRLVELLWPDSAEGAGRASLRQALSTIRKAIGKEAGALIASDRDTVTLRGESLVTDLGTLEDLSTKTAAPDRVEIGFEGAFLEGLSGISPEFDSWRATEQARLSTLTGRLLGVLAVRAEVERRFADAAALLTRALTVEPLAEATHRKLMHVNAAQGRTDAALRQFRALEVLLETELGVRPERETIELARQIRARRQNMPETSATAPPTEAEVGAPMIRPTVLVAPFVEAGSAEDYFASSFTESVIIALSRFDELPVLDLKTTKIGSVMHGEDAAEMAASLGVSYFLSGTIRRRTTRLRVNARLTESSSGRTVWAQTYDREFGDIFEVEDDLSAHVATKIVGQIEAEGQRRARAKQPADLKIIDLIMRGQHELSKYTQSGEDAARRHFEAALAIDPDCVSALAGLAISHIHEFEGSAADDTDRNLVEAQRLAERALALEADNIRARYAMAAVVYYRGACDLAIQHCSRALELNPNDYHTLCSQGWFLTFSVDLEQGLACTTRALSLNPYAPNGCLMVAGFGKFVDGDIEGAIRALTAIRGDNMFKQAGLAACYSHLGRTREADLAVEAFRRLAETDFPGDVAAGFPRTRSYWRRMFRFSRADDEKSFFGALNGAGVPV